MRTRRLGSSGPEISVIGYGAWEAGGADWGPNVSEDSVIDAIHAAMDAGIDWIDTAEVYGDGVSETLVGRAVAGRRDEVRIATKVGPLAAFYAAEDYHQDYLTLHPTQPYIVFNDIPKIENLKKIFAENYIEKPTLVSNAKATN